MEKGFLLSSNYGVQKGDTKRCEKGTFLINENDFPNAYIWSYEQRFTAFIETKPEF
jgi:hypothetical protein